MTPSVEIVDSSVKGAFQKGMAQRFKRTDEFLAPGTISVGANYWASHAGAFMWRDWRPEVVKEDFARLAEAGLQVLRVFPLWPDFQPLNALRGYHGRKVEFRKVEEPLANEAGISEEMLERFSAMADMADENGIDLVVGLITGWMSGRFFAPSALEHLNPITDGRSIMWQVRFVNAFVTHFRGHPAIKAWDLGNECNCMGEADREQAWLWTATIANAIRTADPNRAVISGMHSLSVDPGAPWSIRDQGELTDILTTHPYALFTPHCSHEPLNTMRPLLHAAAETCLYADLSGRPAIVEEFGTLGTMLCSDEVAADMVRIRVFDTWAHDARAALWWCAHDQTELGHAPYDWIVFERELGLFRKDRSSKPVVCALEEARMTIDALPIQALPPRRIDAVCLLTAGQENWGVAFSAFILAKQAGFDIRFHYGDRPLPDADLYLLPSIKGHSALSRGRENELWQKVAEGATLYLSLDDGTLGESVANSGVKIETRSQRRGTCQFWIESEVSATLSVEAPVRYSLKLAPGAEALASEPDGTPVFVKAQYGLGTVYSLLVPLEAALATETGAFSPERAQLSRHIYTTAAEVVLDRRALRKRSPWLGITEHLTEGGDVIAVLINYAPHFIDDTLSLAPGVTFAAAWCGVPPVSGQCGSLHTTIAPAASQVWLLKYGGK